MYHDIETACIIFCGQTIGPNFTKNQAFILEGRSDNLSITDTYLVKSKLYEVKNEVLQIKVPYPDKVRYEIWITEDQPKTPGTIKSKTNIDMVLTKDKQFSPANLNISRWYELRGKKIPRRLFLNQSSISVVDDTKKASLSITVACSTPDLRNFWLVFQSKVNDFIVQVRYCNLKTEYLICIRLIFLFSFKQINSDFTSPEPDVIVVNWTNNNFQCNCLKFHENTGCPFNVKIMIPGQNTQLWKCIGEMFQKTLNSKEKLFWSQYLGT